MLLARRCNRIFSGEGTFGHPLLSSNGTGARDNSVSQTACFLLAAKTEYSRAQAPSVVVHRQMAPESVTTLSHQNHMVFTGR
jgi:hypothetical protein